MYRSILVPLDGSSFGERALPLAARLARCAGAKLSLVHVHRGDGEPELPALTPYQFEGLDARGSDRRTVHEESRYLSDLSRRLTEKAPLSLSTAMLAGAPTAALERYVRESDGDLLVMTTHARGPLGRLWAGSVAQELVCRAGRPVLLVPARGAASASLESEPSVELVLVGLDGSSLAEQVLPPAKDLTRLLGARLELLSVVTPAMVAGGAFGLPAGGGPGATLEAAQQYLSRVAASLGAGLEVETYATAAMDPAAAICQTAAIRGAGIIALATHGRTGFSRLVAGSVAEAVVRNSSRPVLLLRPR